MAGRYIRMPSPLSESYDEGDDSINEAEIVLDDSPSGSKNVAGNQAQISPTDRDQEPVLTSPTAQKIAVLEKAVIDLTNLMMEQHRGSHKRPTEDPNWGYCAGENSLASNSVPTGSGNIRMDQIRQFPKDVPANRLWEEWQKYIQNFEIAASLSQVAEPSRLAKMLFLAVGDEMQSIILAARLKPSLESPSCYKTFVESIDSHLRSLSDSTAEHEAFMAMHQDIGESAVSFHARLVQRVRVCGYSRCDEDRFVRSQLIKGLRNKDLAKSARLFNYETNMIVQAATRGEAYTTEHSPAEGQAVLSVGLERAPRQDGQAASGSGRSLAASNYRRGRKRYSGNTDSGSSQPKRFRNAAEGRRGKCSRCNLKAHKERSHCPALRAKCFTCGLAGHFSATCRRKEVNSMKQEDEKPDEDQNVFALSLEDVLVNARFGFASPIRFLIDSGADVNIVAGSDWRQLEAELQEGLVDLRPVKLNGYESLRGYAADKPMAILCAFEAEISILGSLSSSTTAEFIVVPDGRRSILGRRTASEMHLLRVGLSMEACLVENKPFPKMPGVKVRFNIDHSVTPVRNAYYNVPAAYRESARKRLHEMEVQGIIERVQEAPRWISGMSAVAKGKNDFRLVVNMRAPNKAIKREYYRFPLIQEMKVKLHGAKFFSKLDLTNAYYHLELSKESRELTTFLAENGMFRFTRLMFGVNCAPEIFQREMCRILDGIPNVVVNMDDILVAADSLEKLRTTVAQVMRILGENNLTLNVSKCQLDQERIIFLGFELDAHGFHIEESKVKHIRQFRQPATSSELRSFLGLATFVSPFIKNYADIAGPLWAVASAKSWSWGLEQTKAFESIKSCITQCTVALGYFSESDKTILYTDASPIALGAVLIQEDDRGVSRIISFVSKGLTPTEKRYAQNQREALGAVWAVEYFSFYLLGRHFTLRTDAKGVAFMLNRSREDSKRALTRADGWALRLSPYSYSIEYVKGSQNIADPSSRLYGGTDAPFDDYQSPWEIASLEASQMYFLTEEEVRTETAKDELLLKVILALEEDIWSNDLRRFQAVVTDLSCENGILTKSGCAVIPFSLQKKALEIAHRGHPHVAKLKSILRERIWWPGMPGDAQKWVDSCEICSLNGMPEKPTPMSRIMAPKTVWESIAVDFNGPYIKYGGISILVIIDFRSRYIFAHPVKSTGFEYTRKVLEEIFKKEGFPRFIKSDNGPPFSGEEYKKYCAERGIKTIYSTPLFPQQNGLVENSMKLVNKAMCTATANNANYVSELQQAVQAHNAAAHTVTGVPTEELLSGRKIRRGLPLLRYAKVNHDDKLIDERDRSAKLKGKAREDAKRGARESRVKLGDTVVVERINRAKGETRFIPTRYTVVENRNGSLLLVDGNGSQLRRHISQTKKVQEWRSNPKGQNQTELSFGSSPADKGTDYAPQIDTQQRPVREKRVPRHLQDYAYLIESE